MLSNAECESGCACMGVLAWPPSLFFASCFALILHAYVPSCLKKKYFAKRTHWQDGQLFCSLRITGGKVRRAKKKMTEQTQINGMAHGIRVFTPRSLGIGGEITLSCSTAGCPPQSL